jgi:protein-ribulosamine 3-kinase
MTDWETIAAAIDTSTRQAFRLTSHTAIGGGCINQAYRIGGQDGRYFFVKLNSADKLAMFSAEVAGLKEIDATQTIRVPKPITHGIAGKLSYLVLEQLDLTSRGDAHLLGEQLAAMHRCTGHSFGYSQDNFIGATPQQNGWSDDWMDFWRERRLKFQLRLATEIGYGDQLDDLGMKLLDALPAYFDGYSPQPSLLHGDLWGGNHAFLADGSPAIFDPAVYYGDREVDLAMTELFGGYNADFYTAYRAAYPLHEGYALRRDLYNLYHILNHANMFGGGYVQQAEEMMQRLLAKVR